MGSKTRKRNHKSKLQIGRKIIVLHFIGIAKCSIDSDLWYAIPICKMQYRRLLPNLVGGALLLIFAALLVVGFLVFIGEVVFEPDADEGGRRKRFSDVFKSVFTRRVVPGENDILRTCF